MLRNYLTTALRNLVRNRLYAAITILGLAVAFAVAILVGQFVRGEFSYDRWIPGHERIYKIEASIQPVGQKAVIIDSTPAVGPQLSVAGAGIVTVARMTNNGPLVRRAQGEPPTAEPALYWADPDIFRVLPLPPLAGDLPTALERPDTLVLTRRMARKYFGRDAPIGATLLVEGAGDLAYHPMRVTAVLKDLPPNTNIGAEIFASGRSTYSYLTLFDDHPNLGSFRLGLTTFARLSPAAGSADLRRALDAAGRPDAEAFSRGGGDRMTFLPTPLDELHWQPGPPGTTPRGNKAISFATLAVGALVVLVAAINFVTLMTARAARRGVEVGVRKAAGAGRGDLVVQFIGEALLQVAVSAVIAAALAEALIGPFDALVQRRLTVDFLHDPLLLPGLVGFALMVGVLSAIYPALALSSFRPATVLKGGVIPTSGSSLARTSLVTVQFAVLIGLILTTATIYRQTRFAMARGLGAADSERIVDVFGGCHGAFPEQVRKLPGVMAAACTTAHAVNMAKLIQTVRLAGGGQMQFDVAPVDVGLLEIYGVRPLAGRLFLPDRGEDRVLADMNAGTQPTVVINETAARRLGFADPVRAVGQAMTWTRDLRPDAKPLTGPSRIVGVIPDMPVTVRTPVNPTIYFVAPADVDILSVRLGGDPAATTKAIEAEWKRTGRDQPITTLFLSQFRQNLYLDLTIQGETMAICAGLAILLACLGLFALSAFLTERRTKEIGIRKAMGAGKWDVVRLLLWQFTAPVLCAIAVAAPVGFLAMHDWLGQFAYRVPLSLWTFALAAVAAVAIAWLTVGWQSYVVARSKPAGALQYE
jgi:putative ABC transport system permease protein